MCKLGDIIVVNNYIGEDGIVIGKHSFIVVNDKPDFIEGLGYDLVTNVMSSFKNEEQKNRKLRFMENIEIISDDIISKNKTEKKFSAALPHGKAFLLHRTKLVLHRPVSDGRHPIFFAEFYFKLSPAYIFLNLQTLYSRLR